MIQNRKKVLLNTVFLIIVFALTLYYVFNGQDIKEIAGFIQNADIRYWIEAVICVLLFIGSESIIIYYLMRTIKQKITMKHCYLYSFIGFFFSCITPSASGGQPAQIYYMRKDRIPVPIATLLMMIVTITYKLVLVVIGVGILLIHPKQIMNYLHPIIGWCYLGLLLNTVAVGCMLLLMFHPTLAKRVMEKLLIIVDRIHPLKKKELYQDKLNIAMQEYQDVAGFFNRNKMVVWNVLLITFVQRGLLFYITYLTFCSLGQSKVGVTTTVLLQGMISVAVEMLPLPGGMGISEKLFLHIFTPIYGSIALPGMVISRGLSYYTQLLISAFFTVIAHLVIGKKEEGK